MAEPKIVIFDLEIIPNTTKAVENWTRLNCSWDSSQTLKAEVTSICSFGYEIFGTGKPKVKNAWDYKGWDESVNDDYELCKFAHDILKDADAYVYQNGDRFDLKYINTRFAIHGLPPLPPIPTIDTKKLIKKNYFLLSNSMGHAAKVLLKDVEKMDHGEGWQLWVDTHNKVKKAMKLMAKYCKQDIVTTRELFKHLRPFAKNIPNFNNFKDPAAGTDRQCPSCGGTRLKSHGWRHTKTQSYKRFRCLECLSFSRGDKREENLRSI